MKFCSSIDHSLGDLWNYSPKYKHHYISPIPDITEYVLDIRRDQFLILASDGPWNVISPQEAVTFFHSFQEDELGGGERRENSRVANALVKGPYVGSIKPSGVLTATAFCVFI